MMTIEPTALAFSLYLATVGFPEQEHEEKPVVEVEYDRQHDFSQYERYAWSESSAPATNRADHIRITNAVTDRLAQLGFSIDTAEPQVRVRYRLETGKTKVHVDSSQGKSRWDPTDVETAIALGSHSEPAIIVEMVDAETGALLWRTTCTHLQVRPDKQEQSIQEAVERLFEEYPVKTE